MSKLSDAIGALLPAELGEELRGNIDALVRANFDKMNLVTREQFEIQEKVLHRTRARLLELEKQVTELEKRLDSAVDEQVDEQADEHANEHAEEAGNATAE